MSAQQDTVIANTYLAAAEKFLEELTHMRKALERIAAATEKQNEIADEMRNNQRKIIEMSKARDSMQARMFGFQQSGGGDGGIGGAGHAN